MAGVSFYICIPAAIVLAIAAAIRSRPTALRFIAGGVPFAILLGWYHFVCFGSPFTTTVAHSGMFTEKGLLFGVLKLPTLDALWNLTLGPYRGLFYGAPVLLFALVGAAVMLRRRIALQELATIGAIAMLFLLLVSSFNGWHGGNAWGPRYLLPVVPLLGVPMFFATRLVRPLWIVLAVLSVAMQFLATAVDPIPFGWVANPLTQYLLPAFVQGRLPGGFVTGKVGINLEAIDDPGGGAVHPAGSHEALWAAFNAGELLVGPRRRSSVVPIALWMLAGTAWLYRCAAAVETRR
jgi:hypothetical protein